MKTSPALYVVWFTCLMTVNAVLTGLFLAEDSLWWIPSFFLMLLCVGCCTYWSMEWFNRRRR